MVCVIVNHVCEGFLMHNLPLYERYNLRVAVGQGRKRKKKWNRYGNEKCYILGIDSQNCHRKGAEDVLETEMRVTIREDSGISTKEVEGALGGGGVNHTKYPENWL